MKIAHQFIGGDEIQTTHQVPKGTNENGMFVIFQPFFNRPYGTLDEGIYLVSQR